jgi:hypothetical protein
MIERYRDLYYRGYAEVAQRVAQRIVGVLRRMNIQSPN